MSGLEDRIAGGLKSLSWVIWCVGVVSKVAIGVE